MELNFNSVLFTCTSSSGRRLTFCLRDRNVWVNLNGRFIGSLLPSP